MLVKARGFTIIEIMVYSAISALVMGLLITLFIFYRKSYNVTTSTYLLGQESEVALRWVREDVRETALSSVRVFPNVINTSEPPGLSLASARNKEDEYKIDKSGAPAWEKNVFYTFEKQDGATGNLIRREIPFNRFQPIPTVSDVLPSLASTTKQRIVLRGVLKPEQKITGLEGVDRYGGFRLQFVRSDDTLTSWSPADVTWGKATTEKPTGANTKMLDCQLIVMLKDSSEEKPSFVRLGFRLTPRF